jgi:hypothetical protein
MNPVTLDDLLAQNPVTQSQENLVREALELVKMLRQMGFQDQGYRLAPPFGRDWPIHPLPQQNDPVRSGSKSAPSL